MKPEGGVFRILILQAHAITLRMLRDFSGGGLFKRIIPYIGTSNGFRSINICILILTVIAALTY